MVDSWIGHRLGSESGRYFLDVNRCKVPGLHCSKIPVSLHKNKRLNTFEHLHLPNMIPWMAMAHRFNPLVVLLSFPPRPAAALFDRPRCKAVSTKAPNLRTARKAEQRCQDADLSSVLKGRWRPGFSQ